VLAAIAKCVPGDAATMHPIPGGRPLTRGGKRRNHRLHGAESGDAMRAVIVGAGPTGLYPAIALARRGHQVTVIDGDGAGRTAGSGVTRPGKDRRK
jgi:NADPH-dependent 2,4-dienoyl-CoA reductase/sulfur reductase-like enzyme